MELSALFILYISINMLSLFMGRLVEIVKLPQWLNFKPFNCRLCMSTHTAWILHTLLALLINSWLYFGAGIVAAAVIYYLIYKEDSKQFDI